jgi:DNA-binding CsgD family transcriptional regulator
VPSVRSELSGVSRRDRASLLEVDARLSRISLASPKTGPAPRWLMHELGHLLDCETVLAYRPAEDPTSSSGWKLGESISTRDPFVATYNGALRGARKAFGFDPLRPEVAQRNRVAMLDEVHTHGPEATCVIEEVWPSVGIGGWDQMRALICERRTLLAWVGGVRPEPFKRRERSILTALLPALRRALALRRRLLDAGSRATRLDSAILELDAAAFVARKDGTVLHANAAAKLLIDEAHTATHQRIRHATRLKGGTSLAARIDAAGVPECFLVLLRPDESENAARLRAAATRWGTTKRELEVLGRLVVGDANKEIATKLRLHEGSVERHVTSLLRKARCDGRSRLVARFWTTF